MRRVKCPVPLYVAIIDKQNFEVGTVVEGNLVAIAIIVDDIGYQLTPGRVIPFEWREKTDRLCAAAIRIHLQVGA